MKRALTVIAAVTIGVLSTLVLQNTIFAEYPVDPHQVCIDVVDTDYEGAYNTASGPFTWKCFLHTPGDLEEAESHSTSLAGAYGITTRAIPSFATKHGSAREVASGDSCTHPSKEGFFLGHALY